MSKPISGGTFASPPSPSAVARPVVTQPPSQTPQTKGRPTFHLSVVIDQETGQYSVVISEQVGGVVRRAAVVPPSTDSLQEALDHLNRTATRVWWFNEGDDYFPEGL